MNASEAAVVTDLTVIRELWDRMLPTIQSVPTNRDYTKSGGGLDNVTNLDVVISDRREIHELLRDVTDFIETEATDEHPDSHTVKELTLFVEAWVPWLVGDGLGAFADEIHDAANKVRHHARETEPTKPGKTLAQVEADHYDGSPIPFVTTPELAAFLKSQYDPHVTEGHIRVWKQRGQIPTAHTDTQGRTYYDKVAVIYALQHRNTA